MNDDLKQKIEIVLRNVENMKEPIIDDLNAYHTGLAQGTYNGMTMLASQIRALLEDKPQKPLTMGSRVLIRKGPWSGHYGFYQGMFASHAGALAEVLLEGHDLPVEVDHNFIEVV